MKKGKPTQQVRSTETMPSLGKGQPGGESAFAALPGENRNHASAATIDLFSPIPTVSIDLVGHVEQINLAAAKLVGRAHHDLIGRPFALCVAAEDSPEFLHHLLLCRSKQERVETVLKLRDHSGARIPALLSTVSRPSARRLGNVFQTTIVDLREAN